MINIGRWQKSVSWSKRPRTLFLCVCVCLNKSSKNIDLMSIYALFSFLAAHIVWKLISSFFLVIFCYIWESDYIGNMYKTLFSVMLLATMHNSFEANRAKPHKNTVSSFLILDEMTSCVCERMSGRNREEHEAGRDEVKDYGERRKWESEIMSVRKPNVCHIIEYFASIRAETHVWL